MNSRFFFALLCFCFSIVTQAAVVKGVVVDSTDRQPLVSASVRLLKADADSTYAGGCTTETDGSFVIKGVESGGYLLRVSYLGYAERILPINVKKDLDMEQVALASSSTFLSEVVVTGVKSPIVVKEDTVEYNADSYKTRPDAVVEDLLKRLPGVEVASDGSITANGKTITKIMVDGKEFFLGKNTMATKNIPVKVIDKLQVIEQPSDLAQLTGVDDGETQTVINLTVKKDMKKGWFGNVGGGYGTGDHYRGNVNVNRFVGNNQFSLVGSANNTGAGQGLNSAQSGGLNFNVGNGETFRLGGNINYGHKGNDLERTTNRQYLFEDSTSYYNAGSVSHSHSHSVGGSLRMKWDIDSFNLVEVRPQLSFSFSNSQSADSSKTRAGDELLSLVNSSVNSRISDGDGVNVGTRVLYNHKFSGHKGRSFSVTMNFSHGSNSSDASSYAHNHYYRRTTGSEEIKDRATHNNSWNNSGSVRLTWTEPIGPVKNARFIDLSLNSGTRSSNSNKMVYNQQRDSAGAVTGQELDEQISSQFRNNFVNHRMGVSLRQIRKTYNLSVGMAASGAMSKSRDLFNPARNISSRWVWSVAPRLFFRYRFSKTRNLTFRYQTSTAQPSLGQLQSVPDVTNPLNIVAGNPGLKPTFKHNATFNVNDFNQKSQRNLSGGIGCNFAQNSIITTTTHDKETGGRYTTYANVGGVWNVNAHGMFSMPLNNKVFYVSTSASAGYSQTVGYNNNRYNRSGTYNVNVSPSIAYRTDVVEVSLRPHYAFQMTKNTVQTKNDRNVHHYGVSLDGHYFSTFGLVVDTRLNYSGTSGYSKGYDVSQCLWNASVGYQFFSDKSLTLQFRVNDILHQRKSVSRIINASYIQDVAYNSLTRYAMVTLSYKFKTFAGRKPRIKNVF